MVTCRFLAMSSRDSLKQIRVALFLSLLLSLPSHVFAQSPSLSYLNGILGKGVSFADDPARYALYESLESQVRGFKALIGNNADMRSYYQVQYSVCSGLIDIMQRVRGLLLERSNGFLNADDQDVINSEISQLYDDVLSTLKDAEFNQKKLFLPSDQTAGFFHNATYYDFASVDALLRFLIRERGIAGSSAESKMGSVGIDKGLLGLQRNYLNFMGSVFMLE